MGDHPYSSLDRIRNALIRPVLAPRRNLEIPLPMLSSVYCYTRAHCVSVFMTSRCPRRQIAVLRSLRSLRANHPAYSLLSPTVHIRTPKESTPDLFPMAIGRHHCWLFLSSFSKYIFFPSSQMIRAVAELHQFGFLSPERLPTGTADTLLRLSFSPFLSHYVPLSSIDSATPVPL